MRSILTLVSPFMVGPLFAQIILGPADMPSPGDTMRYRATDASEIALEVTGADMLWDYSLLVPDAEGADTAVAVGATPILYQLFFNNPFIYPDYDADLALRGPAFGFQALTVSDVFEYYKKDGTGYRNVGFGANVNGIPTSVRRIPIDHIHRFPLEFSDADSSFSSFTLDVPTLFSFTQDQLRINTVDGWGTLYLPADTFEVLRVRSVLQRTDSIFIAQFNQGLSFPEPESVEYKWIAAGMDAPVLQVNTTGGQITTARFYYDAEELPTDVSVLNDPEPRLFPNPTNSMVQVVLPDGLSGVLRVCDAAGRDVLPARAMQAGTSGTIDVSALAAGIYTIHVGGQRPWSERLVVR
ncbi:MAG: T9SS type A sorting domain-containing protein [Flavobacteriales bacterium]|nr:T9SS type A sorting domain-containing protein [Flavobacteriales bacterium]